MRTRRWIIRRHRARMPGHADKFKSFGCQIASPADRIDMDFRRLWNPLPKMSRL